MSENKIHYSKVSSSLEDNTFEHKETVKADSYTLTLIIEKLEQQLQAHKEKEDRLREYICDRKFKPEEYSEDEFLMLRDEEIKEILQILDGSTSQWELNQLRLLQENEQNIFLLNIYNKKH